MSGASQTRPSAVVRLSNVELALAGTRILSGLDLTLSERRVGIVGRNGSGKSTLARVMTGLIAADSGEVEVMGVDVARDRKQAIRTIGILFQNPDHQIIFPTVGEELAFGLRQQGRSKKEARELARTALERFGRSEWEERSIETLSQGQKHLVCLMAVLALEPAVIVLDEPFTGLDIPTTRSLQRYLDRLAPTLVHITHDVSSLNGYERVIWIEAGRVHRDGPAGEVLDEYLAAMTREDAADAGFGLPD
ncbi:energy-coupling factor ABC transporter ATP-binding protein [Aliiruegeria sabulilitoris]|uniref:energy-coupling factor ABC transporter ATP-binding protein n=1 Tax=Aliiruegeria sabulilitoris TaxID=1510458 RepID=UPI0009E8AAC5|nr:ABC transporter ATP-binding protein [Aliiruegeria sabulilitoris]NDR59000.1 ABC transporter ATP-binding protein [Pseudoruegeria sp. M32A2M]